MDISIKLKERFCKDCDIPIRVYHEPYFSKRMELLDPFYDCKAKWDTFIKELGKYETEHDYFEECQTVINDIIDHITSHEQYKDMLSADLNALTPMNTDYHTMNDIYSDINCGRYFISIDMVKANFSALKQFHSMNYDENVFKNCSTWEKFVNLFTSNKHIVNSKYIRQVIFGHCSPHRVQRYEKYLMGLAIEYMARDGLGKSHFVCFSHDEVIIDVTDMELKDTLPKYYRGFLKSMMSVPLKVEYFTLHKIHGTDGYIKEVFNDDGSKYILKCVNSTYVPMVIRALNNEEHEEDDLVFINDGRLAKFLEFPRIEVDL